MGRRSASAFVLIPACSCSTGSRCRSAAPAALLPLAPSLGRARVLAEVGDLDVLANFAKLAAVTFFAFWFLDLFEELVLLVVFVALIVPWVDAYSVFRGPTGHIVEHHSDVFTYLSFSWPSRASRTARAWAPRPPLLRALPRRRRPVPAPRRLDVAGDGRSPRRDARDRGLGRRSGLPALPALSVGFLVPNADLIWRAAPPAKRGRPPEGPSPTLRR